MKSHQSFCHYCKDPLGLFESYYNVRKAIKPKGERNRWEVVGKCCETCEINGKLISEDIFRDLPICGNTCSCSTMCMGL